MPDHKRVLADALAANRDLQNRIHQVEAPLLVRIRELEVERDRAVETAAAAKVEVKHYKSTVASLVGLLYHIISTGKL
jgi:hypothetical protein